MSEEKTEKKRAPLLIDEPTILVYPSLAVALGINKAIVFQQLHFLLNGQKEAKNKYNFVEGRWWVYNSYPEWRTSHFPWLSLSSLKGIFLDLEKDGLVIAKQSVKNKSDRRKWYSIDYGQWDKKCLMIGQNLSHQPSDKNCPIHEPENVPSTNGQKVADGYSENKTTSKKTKNTSKVVAPDGAAQKRVRKPDPLFDAISAAWNTRAGGYIGRIKSLLLGKAKGDWSDSNFDVPATPEEVTAFGEWYKKRNPGAAMPGKGMTIQKWFYEYRDTLQSQKLENADERELTPEEVATLPDMTSEDLQTIDALIERFTA